MTPEAVMSNVSKVLTQEQREAYFRDGFLALEGFVGREWLDRLWKVTDGFVEESKSVSKSDDKFDVEPDHSAGSETGYSKADKVFEFKKGWSNTVTLYTVSDRNLTTKGIDADEF